MRNEYISVIIPAYNEEQRVSTSIMRIDEYLRDNYKEFEIIVVDDGSSDETASVVEDLACDIANMRLLRNERNMGKGSAVRKGVLSAIGDLLLMSDADLSTPIEEMEKLLHFINEGFDICIGSRGLKESEIEVRQPWYREGMGRGFNVLVHLFLMRGIKDTQCGFKLFKRNVAQEIFQKCRVNGFGFDVEVLFLAGKLGYGIKEIPIRWINSPASKVGILSDSARMFLDILNIRLNWTRGRYG